MDRMDKTDEALKAYSCHGIYDACCRGSCREDAPVWAQTGHAAPTTIMKNTRYIEATRSGAAMILIKSWMSAGFPALLGSPRKRRRLFRSWTRTDFTLLVASLVVIVVGLVLE
jgi:hypothetical protein